MVILAGSLASGSLPNTQQAIFNASDITFVKSLMLANKISSTETIYLYFQRASGPIVFLGNTVLTQGQRDRFIGSDDALAMSVGDAILAMTTTANAVDFLICGGTGTAGP